MKSILKMVRGGNDSTLKISVGSNIKKLYAYNFLDNFWLDSAIWIIFLLNRGFDMFTIGIAETILHAAIFISEIPTGSVADLYGKKISMAIGSLVNIAAIVMMVTTKNPAILYVAFALYGMSITFRSGADQALLYDSCEKRGIKDRFKELLGNQVSIYYLTTIIAQFLGGFIAKFSFTVLYTVRILTMLAAMFVALSIDEEKVKAVVPREKKNTFIKHIGESFRLTAAVPRLLPLTILFAMYMGVHNVFAILGQSFYNNQKLSTSSIGIIYTIGMIAGIIGSRYASRIDDFIGSNKCLKTSYPLLLLIIIAWTLLPYQLGIMFFIILYLQKSILQPAFSTEMNELIPSKQRATIISISSALTSLFQTITFPVAGFLIDKFNIVHIFIGIAVVTCIVYLTLYRSVFSNKAGLERQAAQSAEG